MNKINRSWRILQVAVSVLMREKKLVLYPVILAPALLIALLPLTFIPTGEDYFSAAHWDHLTNMLAGFNPISNLLKSNHYHCVVNKLHFSSLPPWFWVLTCGIYQTILFITTFCNAAFYNEIIQALNGQAVSIRRGFKVASERWRAILFWSLLAGAVGILIRAIAQRIGFLGWISSSLSGAVWSLAVVFAIPMLVKDGETDNPLKLMQNSLAIVKRTWGELAFGFIGETAIYIFVLIASCAFFLAILVVDLLLVQRGSHVANTLFPYVLCFSIGGIIFIPILLGLINEVVKMIYKSALFIYATEGVIPDAFDKEILDSAWKVK